MPWSRRVDTAATVARLRDDPRGLGDLLRFRHLKKWTAELFAASWGTSQDTAIRYLSHLHEHGLLGFLQAEARATKGRHHGGRGPDVWFLTPAVARGVPVPTAGSIWKYKDAAPSPARLSRTTSPAWPWRCARVASPATPPGRSAGNSATPRRPARPSGCSPPISRCHSSWRLIPRSGDLRSASPATSRWKARTSCCTSSRSTTATPPWRALQAGRDVWPYAWAYATEFLLVLVLNFTRAQRQQRQTMLRCHALAYANRRDDRNYRVSWADLAAVLAAQAERPVWDLGEPIDYDRHRERLRTYWNRRSGDEPTGDFEW